MCVHGNLFSSPLPPRLSSTTSRRGTYGTEKKFSPSRTRTRTWTCRRYRARRASREIHGSWVIVREFRGMSPLFCASLAMLPLFLSVLPSLFLSFQSDSSCQNGTRGRDLSSPSYHRLACALFTFYFSRSRAHTCFKSNGKKCDWQRVRGNETSGLKMTLKRFARSSIFCVARKKSTVLVHVYATSPPTTDSNSSGRMFRLSRDSSFSRGSKCHSPNILRPNKSQPSAAIFSPIRLA